MPGGHSPGWEQSESSVARRSKTHVDSNDEQDEPDRGRRNSRDSHASSSQSERNNLHIRNEPSPNGISKSYHETSALEEYRLLTTGGDAADDVTDGTNSLYGDPGPSNIFKVKSRVKRTKNLAKHMGIRHTNFMYLSYYIPCIQWIGQWKLSHLSGDLIAALTMASFYIPMSLSLASNLAHVPAINGLYSFAINPIVYAVFGTCPQMVVGPEAAGSLLTGSVVRDSIKKGHSHDTDANMHARIAGVVTGTAGAVLLLAGFARIGFIDNVLSRPFLRGFISAIGFVIIVDQLIPEMGLTHRLQKKAPNVEHGSSVEKAMFIFSNFRHADPLTCAVSFGSFAIIMVCREIKRRLMARFPKVAYVPDRFAVVVLATVLTWKCRWDLRGLSVLGDVKSATTWPIQSPFNFSHLAHLDTALSTAFVIALLGFFESSVAAKSLGTGPPDGVQGARLSTNRELVALGLANIAGGTFMALPAFGGYGRSKVNASTGGRTPFSSIFLSIITILCIEFALPLFYYIPKGVLCAMISVVAWSLIEEAPHDLRFFWHIRGWTELFLIFMVFLATIFYSLPFGIACGIGFSVLRVIKHAARPRIQILGRVTGTTDQFENAEARPDRLEFIEGCLIVKIPEPLTFANTGNLKSRLQRLEDYGATRVHPSLPRMRSGRENKNIIFDVHGVTSLDGAGTQVLYEILQSYREKDVRVFFCRLPAGKDETSHVWRLLERSGIVELCGGYRHFVSSIGEALRMTELESLVEHFRDNPEDGV